MVEVSVLFVDDEEDIRQGFQDRFGGQFTVYLAGDGPEALELLRSTPGVNVVVTDIRMPRMDGLELIRQANPLDPDRGFIVISGHGDADDVIEALRLGARNFIRKPYAFSGLEQAIILEAERYRLLQEERAQRERERASEQFLARVDGISFELPNRLEWVSPLTFQIVRFMEAVGLCDDTNRFNVALGVMEIVTNAIEHGNLAMSGTEKRNLLTESDTSYRRELERRASLPAYTERRVRIDVRIAPEEAVLRVTDEGGGFDYEDLPDPTDPENLFNPNGRGILLARTFLDEVIFHGKGNEVTLVKRR